jgi:hypothetical protein
MLREQLGRESEKVLERWRRRILESYPAQTARFLVTEQDPFANPVGHALTRDTQALLEMLTAGFDPTRARQELDAIVRIRAVQSFCPSEALAFVVLLKDVVREVADGLPQSEQLRAELRAFESDVDQMLLVAFDVLVACRDTVHDVAQGQLKNMVHVLIERANRVPTVARGKAADAGDLKG